MTPTTRALRLVHYIARSTRDEHVCIGLTHRPTPMSDTLAETRRSLVERHGAVEPELGPLTDPDAVTLARRQLPDAGQPLDAERCRLALAAG